MSVDSLKPRERECLTGVLGLLTIPEIAGELNLSHHTVEAHLKSARRKLGATSSMQAARYAAARDPSLLPTQLSVTVVPECPPTTIGAISETSAAFPLPVPTRRRPLNSLTTVQTLIWIAVLTLAIAVAFGAFLAGYEALSRLFGPHR